MTPLELAKLQRDYLILTEKESARRLDAEFDALRREISLYLRSNLSPEVDRAATRLIAEIVELLNLETEKLAVRAAGIVARAQNRVVNFAADTLSKFLPEVRTSIFSPDRAAIQKLIGRTQTGKSLTNFFGRFQPVIADRARQSLIEGFTNGESSDAIARRMAEATGAEKFRFLTVSRTETVMAYRNASLEFYDNAGINEYRFLSALDARTCLICWRLHGTVWKVKTKPNIHVNCRCVICPVLKNDPPFKTGIELFGNLEKGVQKQILGKSRFDLFEKGARLDSFVGAKTSNEFGQSYFVKQLAEFSE